MSLRVPVLVLVLVAVASPAELSSDEWHKLHREALELNGKEGEAKGESTGEEWGGHISSHTDLLVSWGVGAPIGGCPSNAPFNRRFRPARTHSREAHELLVGFERHPGLRPDLGAGAPPPYVVVKQDKEAAACS